jgi:hypothetical protein
MSTSQKEAVVAAVEEILGDSFVSGTTIVKETITSDQLSQLREQILTGILGGTIAYSGDRSDAKAVGRYVNGMIDNHFRKAKELNGGMKYAVKNVTGSRGSRDPQLTALRKLAKGYAAGSPELIRVQQAIVAREAQLLQERNAAKAENKRSETLKKIDVSVLPAELSSLITN